MARKYRRDARGRFAGGGYSGQTGGRGARLKSGGAKRVGGGVKAKAARAGGTVSKPRGLKPGAIKPKAQQVAGVKASPKTNGHVAQLTASRNSLRSQLKEVRQKIKDAGPSAGGLRLEKLKIQDRLNQINRDLVRVNATTAVRRPDQAEVNITGRFTGQAGKRLSASIDRAVKQVAAAQRAQFMKPKEQVRAEAAARKASKEAAAAAKPKRMRTPLSLRTSRAKRIVKEREMKISGTLRQWENSNRTQKRALAVYAEQAKTNNARRRRA